MLDSISFTDATWLGRGGFFHSAEMRVVERLTRQGNEILYEVTVEDPEVLVEPWVMAPRILRLNPDPEAGILPERAYCEVYELEDITTQIRHQRPRQSPPLECWAGPISRLLALDLARRLEQRIDERCYRRAAKYDQDSEKRQHDDCRSQPPLLRVAEKGEHFAREVGLPLLRLISKFRSRLGLSSIVV